MFGLYNFINFMNFPLLYRCAKLSIYFGITKLSSKMPLNQHFYKVETTLPNTPRGNLNPELEGKKSSPV
jgi:hypothetical protein